MAVTIADHGQRNRIVAPSDVLERQQGTIILDGDDNTVVLGEGAVLLGARIRLGSACSFTCGSGCRLASIEVHAALRGHVRIGDGTGFTWHTRLLLHEPGEIVLGPGCLIAGDTVLSVSDMHSVVDVQTGRRLNPARNIHVGDRVWLGESVRVLKGATIGAGSIIGAESVVTKAIPPESMAVGSPARVIRQGVTWRHELLPIEPGDGTTPVCLPTGGPDAGRQAPQPALAEIRRIEGLRRTTDGRIISWAQNAEDVMLLRIFGHKRHGTWIDVGANHPSHDSVTRNLYELGWRGINVEPVAKLHELLVRDRPEDVNLRCGVSDHTGEMIFHDNESNPDLSTFEDEAARHHAAGGHSIRDVAVPVLTLADICRHHLQPGQPVDLLKLDVEGHELAVLAGHDFSAFRPTVIVAEVQPEQSATMDELLAARGYERKWFDGGNNWYIDSLQADGVPDAAWRPAYPVIDCYHPWIYAQSFPTKAPAVPPAKWSLLGSAIDAVSSVGKGISQASTPAPNASSPEMDDAAITWLLGRCGRDPASFIRTLHPDDDVYRHAYSHFQSDELARLAYFRYGAWMLSELGHIVEWRFGDFSRVHRMLEFGCGYGRLTRHLVQAMPPDRIWVSDIDERAVAFERATFGVNGFPSATNPANIRCDERFDLIFVVSLFSHLPRHSFRPMLERLLGLLEPGGVLAFTVHDELFYAPQPMPADGFVFVPHSESSLLSRAEYGTTFVTEAFVRECIVACRGGEWPYARLRRGLCSHQDIYLVSNDAAVRYDGLRFRGGPEGCLERCEAAGDGRVELAGWAGDPDPSHRVVEVQVRLDGRLVESCRPEIPRPDVVAVLREPRHATAGWRCLVNAAPPGETAGPMLEVTAVSEDGRTRLLQAGRLAAFVGRKLC
jgi:FkbM family methyltransferase